MNDFRVFREVEKALEDPAELASLDSVVRLLKEIRNSQRVVEVLRTNTHECSGILRLFAEPVLAKWTLLLSPVQREELVYSIFRSSNVTSVFTTLCKALDYHGPGSQIQILTRLLSGFVIANEECRLPNLVLNSASQSPTKQVKVGNEIEGSLSIVEPSFVKLLCSLPEKIANASLGPPPIQFSPPFFARSIVHSLLSLLYSIEFENGIDSSILDCVVCILARLIARGHGVDVLHELTAEFLSQIDISGDFSSSESILIRILTRLAQVRMDTASKLTRLFWKQFAQPEQSQPSYSLIELSRIVYLIASLFSRESMYSIWTMQFLKQFPMLSLLAPTIIVRSLEETPDEKNSSWIGFFGEILSLWASKSFVSSAEWEQICGISQLVLIALSSPRSSVLISSALSTLLEGIQVYLEQIDLRTRILGMKVAEKFSVHIRSTLVSDDEKVSPLSFEYPSEVAENIDLFEDGDSLDALRIGFERIQGGERIPSLTTLFANVGDERGKEERELDDDYKSNKDGLENDEIPKRRKIVSPADIGMSMNMVIRTPDAASSGGAKSLSSNSRGFEMTSLITEVEDRKEEGNYNNNDSQRPLIVEIDSDEDEMIFEPYSDSFPLSLSSSNALVSPESPESSFSFPKLGEPQTCSSKKVSRAPRFIYEALEKLHFPNKLSADDTIQMLQVLPILIERGRDELEDVDLDLCRSLISLTNVFDIPHFESSRINILSDIVFYSPNPGAVAEWLCSYFFETDVSLVMRADCLRALGAAAIKLGEAETNSMKAEEERRRLLIESRKQSSFILEPSEHAGELIRISSSLQKRRDAIKELNFSSSSLLSESSSPTSSAMVSQLDSLSLMMTSESSMRRPPPVRFAKVATYFFFPLVNFADSKTPQLDLVNRDFALLNLLLETLTIVIAVSGCWTEETLLMTTNVFSWVSGMKLLTHNIGTIRISTIKLLHWAVVRLRASGRTIWDAIPTKILDDIVANVVVLPSYDVDDEVRENAAELLSLLSVDADASPNISELIE